MGSIPWVRKILEKVGLNPTAVFLPGESMDQGAWWVTDHRVKKSLGHLAERLSMHANTGKSICLTSEILIGNCNWCSL